MINLKETIRQLTTNAKAISALLQTISDEQGQWKPDPETWSMKDVMEHMYNEERIDFRRHLNDMFSDPPQPWKGWGREELVPVESCRQALESFLLEREASITWLMALETPDWDVTSEAHFGPDEVSTFHTGDILVSWVAHDFLHIRQMNELLYAWNAHQAAPYSVQYGGEW